MRHNLDGAHLEGMRLCGMRTLTIDSLPKNREQALVLLLVFPLFGLNI